MFSIFHLHYHQSWWQGIPTVTQKSFLSPVSPTRDDGPSWRVTGFHYPSTSITRVDGAPVNTARRVMETGHPSTRPLTRAVNSGSGNRALYSGECDRRPQATHRSYPRKDGVDE